MAIWVPPGPSASYLTPLLPLTVVKSGVCSVSTESPKLVKVSSAGSLLVDVYIDCPSITICELNVFPISVLGVSLLSHTLRVILILSLAFTTTLLLIILFVNDDNTTGLPLSMFNFIY